MIFRACIVVWLLCTAVAPVLARAQETDLQAVMQLTESFVLAEGTRPPPDPSNRLEDDPRAVALGERLFFDTKLSADGMTACATCHFTDGAFVPNESRRAGRARAFRTVMPVAGAAYQTFFNWTGSADSLWSQALVPLEHPDEHGLTRTEVARHVLGTFGDEVAALDAGLARDAKVLRGLPPASPVGTVAQRAAWDALDPLTRNRVNRIFVLTGKALAAFEAALPPPVSDWDSMVAAAGGQADRMPPEVLRGFAVFIGRGRCGTCHSGPLFSDGDFHNTGLPSVPGEPVDMGRQAAIGPLSTSVFNCLGPFSDAAEGACMDLRYMAKSKERALGTFRTPTLRGVARRGPYGHAGQMPTLRAMIDHYDTAPSGPHGRMIGVDTLSELVPLDLTEEEKADLIAFLESL